MFIRFLKAAIDFRGRTRRRHFWLVALVVVATNYGLVKLEDSLSLEQADSLDGPVYTYIAVSVVLLIISGIRRLHDVDRRGWWWFLVYTWFGWIWLIVYWCTDGTEGPNRFGPDPKNRQPEPDLAAINREFRTG